jgi:hypothetical protein
MWVSAPLLASSAEPGLGTKVTGIPAVFVVGVLMLLYM